MINKTKGYLKLTSSRVYSVMSALPLFILYEAICFFAALNGNTIRNGADVLLRNLASFTGVKSFQGFFFLSGVAALIYVWPDISKKETPLKPAYFGMMIVESFIYALFLAPLTVYFMNKTGLAGTIGSSQGVVCSFLTGPAVSNASLNNSSIVLSAGLNQTGFLHKFGLMLGAGLYEELFFRLILINLGIKVITNFFKKTKGTEAAIYSVLLSSILFSAFHHIGSLGEAFIWKVFFFRFFAGLILAIIYVTRGFGIAAWSHALYDLLVLFNSP